MTGTELEYCVLGVIWRRGPCSAYEVRAEFARSPSAFWSASAGSIYPVVERLARAGLVGSEHRMQGRRRSSLLQVTKRGAAALRSWISQVDRQSTAATYDPVRTRFGFLDALPPGEERELVLDRVVKVTKERVEELRTQEAALSGASEAMERMAMRGARHELEARIAWLTGARAELLAAPAAAGDRVSRH